MSPKIFIGLYFLLFAASCEDTPKPLATAPAATTPATASPRASMVKNGLLYLDAKDSAGLGAVIELYTGSYSSNYERKGAIHFVSDMVGLPNAEAFNFLNHNAAQSWTSFIRIYKNGKMAIGSQDMNTDPNNYKLFVEKGILTEKVTVAPKNAHRWADYVFNSNYRLMPIAEVANYAKQNKHLPGIPNAAEVAKNGIDLGDMNVKLLQKVEELTLYVALQQKEIEALKKEIRK